MGAYPGHFGIIANTIQEFCLLFKLLLSSIVDGHRAWVEVEWWRLDDFHGTSIGRAVGMIDDIAAGFFVVSVAAVNIRDAINLGPNNQWHFCISVLMR